MRTEQNENAPSVDICYRLQLIVVQHVDMIVKIGRHEFNEEKYEKAEIYAVSRTSGI